MKCEICKKATNWDISYGKPNFIVCPDCFERLAKATGEKFPQSHSEIMRIIFEIADIKEENDREMFIVQ